MPRPLEARPDLVVRRNSAISLDLAALAQKHGLIGCVLITFGAERVGTASWGTNDMFRSAMEELADKVLVKIDDGELDPSIS